MTLKSEPDFFYVNKETGEISWDKSKGESQNTFAEMRASLHGQHDQTI